MCAQRDCLLAGMRGIKLVGQRNYVVGANLIEDGQYVWTITDDGIGKIIADGGISDARTRRRWRHHHAFAQVESRRGGCYSGQV